MLTNPATVATNNEGPYINREVAEQEHDYLRKNVDPVIMPMIEKLLLYQPDDTNTFITRYLNEEPLGLARYSSKATNSKTLNKSRRLKMTNYMQSAILPLMEEFAQRIVYERPQDIKGFLQKTFNADMKNGFKPGDNVEVYCPYHRIYFPANILDKSSDSITYGVKYISHLEKKDEEFNVKAARIRLRNRNSNLNQDISSIIFQIGDRVECRFKGKVRFHTGVITAYSTETGTYQVKYDNGKTEDNVHPVAIRSLKEKILNIQTEKNVVILMIGIDGSGKTTLLSSLKGDMETEHTPSVGFTSVSFQSSNGKTTFYDLGGGPTIRSTWKSYFADCHAVLFVVDSSDPKALEEANKVLKESMNDPLLSGKPLLIYANKQDKPEAMNVSNVATKLGISSFQNSQIIPCIASPKANQNVMDPQLEVGLTWLFEKIEDNFIILNERVVGDKKKEQEIFRKKKEEQKLRVQKWNEEKERNRMVKEDRPIIEKQVDPEASSEQEKINEYIPKCSNCTVKKATKKCQASKWMPVCDECATFLALS